MRKVIIISTLLLMSIQMVSGQCRINNTFFKDGEVLTYDMYFKLGFISSKAGVLSLSISNEKINGKGDYKMTFQTNTSGMANSIYAVHDTLCSYMTKDLVPVAYIKKADEGGSYTHEEVYYSYKNGGKVDINTKRSKNGEFRFDEQLESEGCIYDLVSVIYYARTLNFSTMKEGDRKSINFISGKKLSDVEIEYKGVKTMKGNDKKKYKCIELGLTFMAGSGNNKEKESMKVFVSDDENRIPIQIETNLKKMGAIRGTIKSYEGLKN